MTYDEMVVMPHSKRMQQSCKRKRSYRCYKNNLKSYDISTFKNCLPFQNVFSSIVTVIHGKPWIRQQRQPYLARWLLLAVTIIRRILYFFVSARKSLSSLLNKLVSGSVLQK